MSNQETESGAKAPGPIDEFLNGDQEGMISRPEPLEGVGFENKADDIAHQPQGTSQEHSLDDTQETLTPACLQENVLLEVAEKELKKSQQD